MYKKEFLIYFKKETKKDNFNYSVFFKNWQIIIWSYLWLYESSEDRGAAKID